MHGPTEGGITVAGIGWFLYACFSLVVAYCAMRIAAERRELKEKAARKSLKGR
jgi:hypothetical protein